MSDQARTLPHNLEAERSVLGAVLIENSALGVSAAVLEASHFFRDGHRRIYESFERLAEKKRPIDLLSVADDLERKGELQEAGGPAYLASLVDGVPRSTNVDYYAEIVFKRWQAREVIFKANAILAAAYDGEHEVADIIGEGVANLTDIGAKGTRGGLVGGEVLAREALAWLEEIEQRAGRAIAGFQTGLPAIDNMTDGLQPGDLSIVAARPSQGKTALGLQIARNDGPSAFFSLEMKRAKLAARILAAEAQVDSWALRRGKLDDREYARLAKALEKLSVSNIAIDDAPAMTVAQIRAKARQYQQRNGLKLVAVDYLSLVTPRATISKREFKNREREVAEMAQGLKELARELNIHVMVLAQLNREKDKRNDEPRLSDLRESGAIEQIADLIMFIHRENGRTVADEGEAQIIIAKQREGPIGRRTFLWVPSQTRFMPIAA